MVVSAPHDPAPDLTDSPVAAERLTFFGDAVIAIALTLLALELPMPEGRTNAEVVHSAIEHRDEYLAFLISFVVIGARWNGHHRVFHHVTALGGRLTGLSFGWLLMQVVTPFATKVLTGDGAFQVRFACYATVQVLAGVLFLLMVQQIRVHRLYRPGTPPELFTHTITSTAVMAAGFLVSIPVSFFTGYAYVCWVAAPMMITVLGRLRRKRAGSAA